MSVDSTKSKCPGQNTMFWRPGDIFDVECGTCGAMVEFFKDEVSRRCSKCGSRVRNPKLNLGCAQWCEHAKECLGYDPKEQLEEAAGESVSDSLVAAMKKEFGTDEKRITHALNVLVNAERIMKSEGGDPRIVIPAAILHDIGIKEAEKKHGSAAAKYQELEGPPIAKAILKDARLDNASISDIIDIIANHHSAQCAITPEFKVVWDADWLVNIPDEFPDLSKEELKDKIEKLFRTETGKRMAHEMYVNNK